MLHTNPAWRAARGLRPVYWFRGRAAARVGQLLRLLVLLLLGVGAAFGQQRPAPAFLRDDAAAVAAARTSPLNAALRHARPLSLDLAALQAALAAVPLENSPAAVASGGAVILLPL